MIESATLLISVCGVFNEKTGYENESVGTLSSALDIKPYLIYLHHSLQLELQYQQLPIPDMFSKLHRVSYDMFVWYDLSRNKQPDYVENFRTWLPCGKLR